MDVKKQMHDFVEAKRRQEEEEEGRKLGDLSYYSTTQLKAEIRRRKGEPRKSK